MVLEALLPGEGSGTGTPAECINAMNSGSLGL